MTLQIRQYLKAIACCCLIATASSCVDYDSATQTTSVSIQLVAPEGLANDDLAGKTVTLKSHEGRIVNLTTDKDGVASTSDLIPDLYNISASWSLSRDLIVSGSLPQRSITSHQELTLQLRMGTISPLLISKVYMAGSKDKNNVNYLNGSYVEIYNQSDDTVDVAGLYIGLLDSGSNIAYTLEQLHEQHADSVVLLKQLFRIPKAEHLMAPGDAIILCNSAIDHSVYSDMEHSLLEADYEAKDVLKRVTNNSEVTALETPYLQTSSNMSNMNLTRGGPCGLVIFMTDEDPQTWGLTYKYPNTGTTGAQWMLMPKRLIMDGVDILHRKTSGIDTDTKRLYTDIDAGYTALTTVNGLDGEVICRVMTNQTGANGHRLLQDTNNSSNDFFTSKTIKPKEYE